MRRPFADCGTSSTSSKAMHTRHHRAGLAIQHLLALRPSRRPSQHGRAPGVVSQQDRSSWVGPWSIWFAPPTDLLAPGDPNRSPSKDPAASPHGRSSRRLSQPELHICGHRSVSAESARTRWGLGVGSVHFAERRSARNDNVRSKCFTPGVRFREKLPVLADPQCGSGRSWRRRKDRARVLAPCRG